MPNNREAFNERWLNVLELCSSELGKDLLLIPKI